MRRTHLLFAFVLMASCAASPSNTDPAQPGVDQGVGTVLGGVTMEEITATLAAAATLREVFTFDGGPPVSPDYDRERPPDLFPPLTADAVPLEVEELCDDP